MGTVCLLVWEWIQCSLLYGSSFSTCPTQDLHFAPYPLSFCRNHQFMPKLLSDSYLPEQFSLTVDTCLYFSEGCESRLNWSIGVLCIPYSFLIKMKKQQQTNHTTKQLWEMKWVGLMEFKICFYIQIISLYFSDTINTF